ncbi:MAG TPA: phosphomannomutase/phosphoglucomutase [Oceanospirillales bacterium]|nr:phosphomannomutase [Oceanospirillaceae bacterium]HBS41341.1 phosphomannomutase/phosphoglucomutase [Oceanospirillales bacterium]
MGKGSTPGLSLTGLSRLYLWFALLIIAAGLLAQQMQIRYYADSIIHDDYTVPLARQLASSIQTGLTRARTLQDNIARHPLSLTALNEADSDWATQIQKLIPGAVRATLLTPEQAGTLHQSYNYSVQDMVNKSLRGQNRGIEATRTNAGIRYFCVSPVADGERIAGVLLVEYGSGWESALWEPLKSVADQVRIYQSVSGPQDPGLSLWNVNDGKGTGQSNTQTITPYWYLTLTPVLQMSEMTLIYSAYPWIAALILTFITLFLLHGFIHSRVRRDQQLLYHYLSYDFSGPESPSPLFKLRLFNELAELIRGLITPTARAEAQNDRTHLSDEFYASLNAPPATNTERALPGAVAEFQANQEDDADTDDLHTELSLEEPPSAEIPEHIFRAYDIRGLVANELTQEFTVLIGRALGAELKARDQHRIHLAWDGRHSSPALADALQQGLTRSGISVNRLGMVPVGVLYFATHQKDCDCGVMITGSHNPKEYNGIKAVVGGLPLSAAEIQDLKRRIQEDDYAPESSGMVTETSLLPEYLSRITGDLTLNRPMTVVIDAGNGVTGPVAEDLFRSLGAEVVSLYCDIDGDFPNHHPDPGIADNLTDLCQTVRQFGADLGLAFDGDGDRVAVVDNQGNIVSPDHILMLLIEDILPRNPGRDVVFDVKSSRYLSSFISRIGGRPTLWKTGHSLMKQKMHELNAVVGGEYSGHFYIGDRWYGFDDGLYNGARLLEILSIRHNSTVADVFSGFPADVSTGEITLTVGEERKFPLIQALSQDKTLTADARVTRIDGLRIEYPDGWGLVRASNTTPKLTLRFAGNNEATVERIQSGFRAALQREAPDLELSF